MALQTQTCCFCFDQRTGCYRIGAFNVVIGTVLFLQGVHTGCVNGSIYNTAISQLLLAFIYLSTSVCLLRGVKLVTVGVAVLPVLRLIGEALYVGFGYLDPYQRVKEWSTFRHPVRGDYSYSEYAKANYEESLAQYNKDVAKQDAEKLIYAAQKLFQLEAMLAHFFIMIVAVYFMLSVHMYRRRLRTEKEAARPAQAVPLVEALKSVWPVRGRSNNSRGDDSRCIKIQITLDV